MSLYSHLISIWMLLSSNLIMLGGDYWLRELSLNNLIIIIKNNEFIITGFWGFGVLNFIFHNYNKYINTYIIN